MRPFMRREIESVAIAASCERVFDLIHDYDRRLEWDPMLREARLLGGAERAGKGVRSRCVGSWRSGFIGMETEYVTYERGRVAAIKLVNRPAFFASFAATIRHAPVDERLSRVTYLYHFRARPRRLAPLLEPLVNAMLRNEIRLRLRALKRFLEG
jgi:hypothetical protein